MPPIGRLKAALRAGTAHQTSGTGTTSLVVGLAALEFKSMRMSWPFTET